MAKISDLNPSWNEMNRNLKELDEKLENYIQSNFEPDILNEAIDFFYQKDNAEVLPDENQLFIPWFTYTFRLEFDSEFDDSIVTESFAGLYLIDHAGDLSDLQLRIVKELCRTPLSFYKILKVKKGLGLEVKDLLRGNTCFVHEKKATEFLRPGLLIFGLLLNGGDLNVFNGLSSRAFPDYYEDVVVKFKKKIFPGKKKISSDDLFEYQDYFLRFYRELVESLDLQMKSPIRNMSGDSLSFHRLNYIIPSAEEAFQKLYSLCEVLTMEEMLENAVYDKTGKLEKAYIDWVEKNSKGRPEYIQGRIEIDGKEMTVRVNSNERADRIKKIIEKLYDASKYINSIIESPNLNISDNSQQHLLSGQGLMENPEILQKIKELVAEHWKNWLHEPVPALENMIPQEAAKTKKGRKLLENLLQQFESRKTGLDDPNRIPVEFLRRELGM